MPMVGADAYANISARLLLDDLVEQVEEPFDEDRPDFIVLKDLHKSDTEVFSLNEQKLIETLWRKYFV